jgi:YjbE family integral membrane protein
VLAESLQGIAQVLAVDLLLAADNAVVIGLACRGLPPQRRLPAVVLGVAAAIVLRVTLTLAAVPLLELPLLRLAGGLLLAVIAVRLVAGDADDQGRRVESRAGIGGAVRTIVMADAAMSIDNILAVAAASGGSAIAVIAGLAISMTLVAVASGAVMRAVALVPALVVAGGGFLGWIAFRLAVTDPALAAVIAGGAEWLPAAIPVAGALAAMAAGVWLSRRRARRSLGER